MAEYYLNNDPTPDPSGDSSGGEGQKDQQGQGAREGDYKNVETSVNNPSYFNDEKVDQMENDLAEEEPRTEDNARTGKK